MDFSDIFSGDTWDTVSNVLGNPLVQTGAGLLAGLQGSRNASNLRDQTQGTLNTLNQLYSPNSPYAQQLRQQLERRDAAAGRRSQYGPRETELAAKLTQLQSGQLMNPQYQTLLRGSNTNPYASLYGALGYAGRQGQQQRQGSPLVNAASKLNSLRRGYNQLSGLFGAADTGTAADLGGAASSLGETFGSGSGALDAGGGIFGSPSEMMLSPFSATNTADPLGSFASSIGDAGYMGLGGAGDFGGALSALSGMGTGSTAGTVGSLDTLGSLFGGTGYLPGYTSTAGSSLFGSGAGSAAGASEGAGAAGAGFGGLGAMTALPFGIAAYGMLNGIFGGSDDGTPFTQANDAWTNAVAKDPSLMQRFGQGDVNQYMQGMFGGDNWSNDQYDQAKGQLAAASGGGTLLGNLFGFEQGGGG